MGNITLTSVDAEEAVLWCCLSSSSTLQQILDTGLKDHHFSSYNYTLIFKSILYMIGRGEHVDRLTLISKLEAANALDEVGGTGVIDRLINLSDYSLDSATDYSEIIIDRSVRRNLRTAVDNINHEIYTNPDIKSTISSSEKYIFDVSDTSSGTTLSGFTGSDIKDIFSRRTNNNRLSKIPYPFEGLNKEYVGRNRGTLTVWGGYSSDGKSTIGLSSLIHAATHGSSVAYYSLEMSEEELMYRMLAQMTGINPTVIENDNLDLHTQSQIGNALEEIASWNIKIYSDPSITPYEVASRQNRERVDHIIVDYLQRHAFTRWEEIPRKAKEYKNISLSTKCSIDLLSQLTPTPDFSGGSPFPKPNIHSLYGGKATSHEADNVIFIWSHRDKATGWKRSGTGEIIVGKYRGGIPEMAIPVVFDKDRVCWREVGQSTHI